MQCPPSQKQHNSEHKLYSEHIPRKGKEGKEEGGREAEWMGGRENERQKKRDREDKERGKEGWKENRNHAVICF